MPRIGVSPKQRRGIVDVFPCLYDGVPMPWSNVSVARGFAFVAGTEGWEPTTLKIVPSIEKQTWMCLEKIRDRLLDVGTSIENAVMMTIYLTDATDYFSEAVFSTKKFFSENCPKLMEVSPVATITEVGALARRDMKIEIDCIAAMPSTVTSRSPVTILPLEYGDVRMPWSKAAIANGFVFLSGVEACDPHTLEIIPDSEDQVWTCLEQVKVRLDEAGTSMENIVAMPSILPT